MVAAGGGTVVKKKVKKVKSVPAEADADVIMVDKKVKKQKSTDAGEEKVEKKKKRKAESEVPAVETDEPVKKKKARKLSPRARGRHQQALTAQRVSSVPWTSLKASLRIPSPSTTSAFRLASRRCSVKRALSRYSASKHRLSPVSWTALTLWAEQGNFMEFLPHPRFC